MSSIEPEDEKTRRKLKDFALKAMELPREIESVLGRPPTNQEIYYFFAQVARTYITAGYGLMRRNDPPQVSEEFLAYVGDQIAEGFKAIGHDSQVLLNVIN